MCTAHATARAFQAVPNKLSEVQSKPQFSNMTVLWKRRGFCYGLSQDCFYQTYM